MRVLPFKLKIKINITDVKKKKKDGTKCFILLLFCSSRVHTGSVQSC